MSLISAENIQTTFAVFVPFYMYSFLSYFNRNFNKTFLDILKQDVSLLGEPICGTYDIKLFSDERAKPFIQYVSLFGIAIIINGYARCATIEKLLNQLPENSAQIMTSITRFFVVVYAVSGTFIMASSWTPCHATFGHYVSAILGIFGLFLAQIIDTFLWGITLHRVCFVSECWGFFQKLLFGMSLLFLCLGFASIILWITMGDSVFEWFALFMIVCVFIIWGIQARFAAKVLQKNVN